MTRFDELTEAFELPQLDTAGLRLEDCRRLTGPGLLWDRIGAVADVAFVGHAPAEVTGLWHRHGRLVLDALGWMDEATTARTFDGGANLALSGPIDRLYTAVSAAEAVWHFCAAELLGVVGADFGRVTADLRALAEAEADPRLAELVSEAQRRDLDALSGEDMISIGHGCGSQSWKIGEVPRVSEIAWDDLKDIPLALVTGTNGKTTTTRLLMAMGRAAGLVAGMSSTENVRVGDDMLAEGDFSGPSGARLLLRDHRLQMGILEVARGGLLRRGLPVRHGRVAVVTNAAADHLGQYGVNTVTELAQAKMAVRRGLKADGVMVLNADDPLLVAESSSVNHPVWWFSLNAASPQIAKARQQGQTEAWIDGASLMVSDANGARVLVTAPEIPIAMGGAARHNLANAMAAVLAARALGITDEAIASGLRGFQSDPRDNPGRANEFAWNGARVFVDFAHNPHSIAAVTEALATFAARRRFVLLSHAGDRSDDEIKALARGAFALRPDFAAVAENPDYLRGRAMGEIPALMRAACLAEGMPAGHVLMADNPADGAAKILARLEPGDLALLLVHADRDKIFAMLGHQSAPSRWA